MAGFWEPHDASIDFCEANYRFSPYVAEMLNSTSSLIMVIMGFIGWWVTPSPYDRWARFHLSWFLFAAVGFGSLAFHATLRRPAQAMDEVPMVLGNLILIYSVWSLGKEADKKRGSLCSLLLMVAIFKLIIYFVFEFYAVFLSMYMGGLALLMWKAYHRCHADPKGKNQVANAPLLKFIFKLAVGTYLSGGVIWIIDNLACSILGVGHLHILWHLIASLGTAFFVLMLVCLAANDCGNYVKINHWFLFAVPCLAVSAQSFDATSGKKGK